MNQTIRFGIAAIFFLGIIFLSYDRVAQADPSADPSASAQEGQSVFAAPDDEDCKKDKNKNKDKCKGTVKTPPHEVVIPVTGEYSVGGFCTLSIELSDSNVRLDATLETPLPEGLPDTVQQIRQGCLLTYYSSDERIDTLPATSGNTTICFAALPNQQMVLYFYNFYDPDPVWTPMETTVEDGLACGPANASGVYIATFQK